LPVTRRFVYLEEGDVAVIRRKSYEIYDRTGQRVERTEVDSDLSADSVERGRFRHFMQEEIHEQPVAIANTLAERLSRGRVLDAIFGLAAADALRKAAGVHIVACGTSFHAGMIARYQIEELTRLPCSVEIASEYRYRRPVVPPNTLFVTISQSGETADTLAALGMAKRLGYLATLAICNVPESSLVRESDLVLMTRAGPEIGVASTKAFTTQLTALGLLVLALAKSHGMDSERERGLVQRLLETPSLIEKTLELDETIKQLATHFA